MKKGQWFMNDGTGVITNIHREAVEWYRQGGKCLNLDQRRYCLPLGSLIRKGEYKNETYSE